MDSEIIEEENDEVIWKFMGIDKTVLCLMLIFTKTSKKDSSVIEKKNPLSFYEVPKGYIILYRYVTSFFSETPVKIGIFGIGYLNIVAIIFNKIRQKLLDLKIRAY